MSLLDTRHKRKSFTLTTVILSGLILLMFYVGLSYLDPPIEAGISVNFGYTEVGSGKVQPREPVRSEPVEVPEPEPVKQEEVAEPPVESTPEEAPAEEVVTQESEESLVIKKAEEERLKKLEAERKQREEAERLEQERIAEEQRKERERQAEQERIRQEQEAKRKQLDAMMGGLNKSDGAASGEGDDQQAGDKGQLNGDPYASSYFGSPGTGSGGLGYGLNGRDLVSGEKFVQECNESGRVVVRIEVDRNGRVIHAEPGIKGSTNTAACLKEAAEKTARSYRWNADANAPTRQIGFVVVNFKLGE